MSINIVELTDSIIADLRTLEGELVQVERAQRYVRSMIKTVNSLLTTLNPHLSVDGSLGFNPVYISIETSPELRTAFATFETSTFLFERILVTNLQHEQLKGCANKMMLVKKHINILWNIEI